ncbi:MAG: N-acetyl-gamma-glutamyl-phosphate reductase [Cyclobacteriaceae bacterium]
MKTKVGIIGGAGYTAGELLRLLVNHPSVEVVYVQSASQAGKKVSEVHQDLIGEIQLEFQLEVKACEINFLCKGHGASKDLLERHPELLDYNVIDLSQDFRLKGDHSFVYGLPEKNTAHIQSAHLIANPGCFATSIQLALLPSVKKGVINSDIHVSGITGSTGAGQSFSTTSHYSWRHGNASVYKSLNHQHLLEIGETVLSYDSSFDFHINFIPYRGAFTRGIITTSYFDTELTDDDLRDVYNEFYPNAPFTHVVETNPDVKQVVNTNKCLVFPQVINGKAVVVSVIDNLLKGAVGQAVQNMNLLLGIDEKTGLQLKSTAF